MTQAAERSRTVHQYGAPRHRVKAALYRQQDGQCGICNRPLPRDFRHSPEANLDHKWCRAHGGPDVLTNLQLTHSRCNSLKGSTCSPGSPCRHCFPPMEETMSEKIECDRCHEQWQRPVDVRDDPMRTRLEVKVPHFKPTGGPLIDKKFDLCQKCARSLVVFIIGHGAVRPSADGS